MKATYLITINSEHLKNDSVKTVQYKLAHLFRHSTSYEMNRDFELTCWQKLCACTQKLGVSARKS